MKWGGAGEQRGVIAIQLGKMSMPIGILKIIVTKPSKEEQNAELVPQFITDTQIVFLAKSTVSEWQLILTRPQRQKVLVTKLD